MYICVGSKSVHVYPKSTQIIQKKPTKQQQQKQNKQKNNNNIDVK